MKLAPRLSVAVPCYGEIPFIEETLESIRASNLGDIEVLLVDDGSVLPLEGRFQELKSTFRDLNIRSFVHSNGGPAKARNTAIANANSDLILPLDSDDRLVSSHAKAFLGQIENDPSIDFIYGDFVSFGSQSELRKAIPWEQLHQTQSNGIPYCAIYRKTLWQKVGGYNEVIPYGVEDWQFWIHTSHVRAKGKYLELPLLEYRVHDGTLTGQVNHRDLETKAAIILSLPDAFSAVEREWAQQVTSHLSQIPLLERLRGKRKHRIGVMPSTALAELDIGIFYNINGNPSAAVEHFMNFLSHDEIAVEVANLSSYARNLEYRLGQISLPFSRKVAKKLGAILKRFQIPAGR